MQIQVLFFVLILLFKPIKIHCIYRTVYLIIEFRRGKSNEEKSLIGICVFTILLVAGGMGTTKTASQLITDEQQFVCWLDSTVYVQKQKLEPIFADFMLAEYEKDGQVFPAVYDDRITIWCEPSDVIYR